MSFEDGILVVGLLSYVFYVSKIIENGLRLKIFKSVINHTLVI